VVEFGPALAGLHVVAVFKDQRIVDRRVVQLSAERGVMLQPLSRHGTTQQGLVLGFTTATAESAGRALNIVRAAIRSAR
jgi:GntR family transcriptional regulator/MocR family aminotransferase